MGGSKKKDAKKESKKKSSEKEKEAKPDKKGAAAAHAAPAAAAPAAAVAHAAPAAAAPAAAAPAAAATYAQPAAKVESKEVHAAVPATTINESQAAAVAAACRKAMQGMGTNEKMLIDNIGDKTPGDMKLVQASYKAQFNRDFVTDLKDECSGKFLDILVSLCTDPADLDAQLIRKAVAGLGTDESLLSEVLCTRTPGELKAAAASYQKLFSRNMEADIKSDVSGDLGKVYAAVFSPARGTRSGNAAADVEALYKAGAGKLGTDEASFINIIASSTKEYAEQLFYEYAKKYGKSLDVVIRDEMSGDAGKALATLATPPHVLFSDKIHKCMAGMGTNDTHLIRLLTTQRGRHLKAAGKHYLEVHRQSISAAVTSETSGDYRGILLRMLGAEGV